MRCAIQVFVDVNECLIRTGAISREERAEEFSNLERVARACAEIGSRHQLSLVLASGNSFEYCRRVEEPFGLHLLGGVEVVIVSENGLIARSFESGELWRCQAAEEYWRGIREFDRRLREDEKLRSRWYIQGNEIRFTVKPTLNCFSESELDSLRSHANDLVSKSLVRAYSHPFYFDLDPLVVAVDGQREEFQGKSTAVRRLVRRGAVLAAVGDSASDVSMFKEVLECGGRAFWVGNSRSPELFRRASVVKGKFGAGVLEVLQSILEEADSLSTRPMKTGERSEHDS